MINTRCATKQIFSSWRRIYFLIRYNSRIINFPFRLMAARGSIITLERNKTVWHCGGITLYTQSRGLLDERRQLHLSVISLGIKNLDFSIKLINFFIRELLLLHSLHQRFRIIIIITFDVASQKRPTCDTIFPLVIQELR